MKRQTLCRLFRLSFLFLLLLLCTLGCQRKRVVRLATGGKTSIHRTIGGHLKQLFHQQLKAYTDISLQTQGSSDNLRQLLQGKADFALVQNDALPTTKSKKENLLRTVLPLYTQVLFVLYKPSIQAKSLAELVKGRRISVGPKLGGTAQLVKRILASYGIPRKSYTLHYHSYRQNTLDDDTDIVCTVTGYNNIRVNSLLRARRAKLWSFGDPNLIGKGSSIDGFCLHHPLARPFVIPKLTYRYEPQHPILTVGVDNVMVTRKDVSPYLIYDLVKAMLEQKEWLAQQNPLFHGINLDPRKQSLHFPLHKGTKMYLEKDKPPFLVRYAETIALLLSVGMLLFGGLSGLVRWRQRSRKEQIDLYYQEVLDLEHTLIKGEVIDYEAITAQLFAIRNKAMAQLMAEKLEGDENFRILLVLFDQTYQHIQLHQNTRRNRT